MSEKKSRLRRKLQRIIPADKKADMKKEIDSLRSSTNTVRAKMRAEHNAEVSKLVSKYKSDVRDIESAYEESRATVIDRYEKEYGTRLNPQTLEPREVSNA